MEELIPWSDEEWLTLYKDSEYYLLLDPPYCVNATAEWERSQVK